MVVNTSFNHIGRPDCERAPYVFKRRERHACGKSKIVFDCPWCGAELKANAWSLAGSGKRCQCGAIFGARLGYKLKPGAKP